ncbi:MAG: thioredoxin family protein [Pseudomonadota bacterium]
MKPVILSALLSLMIVLGGQAVAAPKRALPSADRIAVYVMADWCPNCKIIAPKWTKIQDQFRDKKILFITLDLSDKGRINQAIMHAQALGIGPFLQQQGSGTGYIALLKADTKQEITRFDRDTTEEEMIKALSTP